MRAGENTSVDLDVKLQRHPDLVRSIARPDCVFRANAPRGAMQLSPEALEILDGFARPRKVRDVVPDADADVLDALGDWVARGLLVRTPRPLSPSRTLPPEVSLWSGAPSRRRTRKVTTTRRAQVDGSEVVVLDGAFTPEEIDAASCCFERCPYERIVQRGFSRDVYDFTARVPFVDVVGAVVERAYPRRRLELYWAYCNRTRYGDAVLAHADSQTPSVTALYYANATWDDDWGGETYFYGSDREATVVVAPKPGRLCLFDGRLVHRGGVPSRMCHEGRLTVVLKYWVRGESP